jgi:predicted enzyme related to lactoylglutathione lyase
MSAGRAVVGHFEIPAADPERAAHFYRAAFGWRVQRRDWEGGPYYAIRTEESAPEGAAGQPAARSGQSASTGAGIPGGLTTPEVLGSDRPLLVVHVEGAPLEDWLGRIVAAGGRVEGAIHEVSGVGRFARFLDPEGNMVGIWAGVAAGRRGGEEQADR